MKAFLIPLLFLTAVSEASSQPKAYIDTMVFLNKKGESVKVPGLRKSLQSTLGNFEFEIAEYALNAPFTEEMRKKQLATLSARKFDVMVIATTTYMTLVKSGADIVPLYEFSDSPDGTCQRTATLLKSTGPASKDPHYGIVGIGNPANAGLRSLSQKLKLKLKNFANYQALEKAVTEKTIDGALVYFKANGAERDLHPLKDSLSAGRLSLFQNDSDPIPCSIVVANRQFAEHDSLKAFVRSLSKSPEVTFHPYPLTKKRQKRLHDLARAH